MQLIGIISFPKRETFSMGYFIEKQEWCDKMSHHLCYDVSCNIIYYLYFENILFPIDLFWCRLPAQTATCAIFGGHSVT